MTVTLFVNSLFRRARYMMKKKNLLLTIIGILVLIICIVGYTEYHNNQIKEETISRYTTKINKEYHNFKSNEDRSQKYILLKDFYKEQNEYAEKENNLSEIKDIYKDKYSKMQDYFVEDYAKVLKDNSLKDEDIKSSSKDVLNNAKTNLNDLSKNIKEESKYILNGSNKKIKKYTSQIDSLVKKYDERIKSIEEEEAKKAEEEKKAQEEAQKNSENGQNGLSNSSSNGSVASNGGSSYNGSYNGGSSNYGNGKIDPSWNSNWVVDSNGNKVPGSTGYTDNQGNMYNENGDYIGNLGDWCGPPHQFQNN